MSSQKVFFTSPIFGFPPAGGPELRILNTIKVLVRVSDVTVQIRRTVTEEEKILFDRELTALGCRAVEFTQVRAKRESKRRSSADYAHAIQNRIFKVGERRALAQIESQLSLGRDVILWFGFGNISFPLIRSVRRVAPNAKIVCDTDSVWSRFLLRGMPYTTSVVGKARLYSRGWKKQIEERRFVSLSTITTAVSKVDADYYRSISKRKNDVQIVSNVIDIGDYEFVEESDLVLPAKSVCLVGTFGHPASPMDIGAKWLIEEVWPLVQERVPMAHLFIVGKNSDMMWSQCESETVHVTGLVSSTGPYIKNCDAIVVPLFFESGTRFKILEAGAYSRPVISTTLGAEGLPVAHGHDILIADRAEAFANAIIETLLGAIEIDLGKNLKSLVLRDYTLDSLSIEIESVLSTLRAVPSV
jgi:glycosyltransferase involved in cell wall biosynthesis